MRLMLQGLEYTKSMVTGWKPPAKIRRLSEDDHQAVRDKFHIITEGDHLVPPVTTFQDLKFPPAVLRQLASKGIEKPTPIQMQVSASRRTPDSAEFAQTAAWRWTVCFCSPGPPPALPMNL